ncbi:MAG: cation:proton antiporter, partial [bacterium]|nr:cation:proton antiporter [Candidatus Kapabacteria bacterium]
MDIPILRDLLIVAGLAVVILTASYHLRIPGVVGLLLAGVVIGPKGLGLMDTTHNVEIMAEIGVVLLLFTIGIEFSLTKLFRIRRLVLVGGSLQVIACIAVAWLVGIAVGIPSRSALFAGFLLAMSSTAIVLQALQERSEIESPHGRAILGLLVFQDVAIVPLMLFAPMLAGEPSAIVGSLAAMFAKLAGVAALVFVGSRYIVPFFLEQIARVRSRELFVLAAVAICLTVAWITSSLGLSLGLGAFLAGLIISETDYSHQTLGGILPFRDVFTSLFFVSIGMLLDIEFLIANPLTVLAVLAGVLVLKSVVVALIVRVIGYPMRSALITGIAICQVGEFAFLLARTGLSNGLLDSTLYQTFLSASVLSMAAAPFLIRIAPSIARMFATGKTAMPDVDPDDQTDRLEGHMVIIGFGFAGQSVARAARRAGLVYVAVDSNADNVIAERDSGEPVVFGDAAYATVLEHLQIARAKIVVVVVSDAIATRLIVRNARDLNPDAMMIVRTRFVSETDQLIRLGASLVIPEQFETAIEAAPSAAGIDDSIVREAAVELRSNQYANMRHIESLARVSSQKGRFAEPADA